LLIFFSGVSLKRDPFWNFTRKVIEASESVGLKMLAVTTDMGPANTGLWNHIGVQSTRTMLTSAVVFSCAADRSLYFIADRRSDLDYMDVGDVVQVICYVTSWYGKRIKQNVVKYANLKIVWAN